MKGASIASVPPFVRLHDRLVALHTAPQLAAGIVVNSDNYLPSSTGKATPHHQGEPNGGADAGGGAVLNRFD